jgi:capsid portal protein
MAKQKTIKINKEDNTEKLSDVYNIADIIAGGITPQLFNKIEKSLYLAITKKEQGMETQPTNQQPNDVVLGATGIAQPVDIYTIRNLKDISPHHASCIQSKKYSIMGLGFVSEGSETQAVRNDTTTPVDQVQQQMQNLLTGEAYIETKVDKLLDPLTLFGFAFELYRVIEDFLDGGTGYLEVVRDDSNKIIGLNWLPYESIEACLIKNDAGQNRLVYKYVGNGLFGTTNKYYALFGTKNKEWVKEHFYANDPDTTLNKISEVIPFICPSNQSQYYGYPEWLSASTMITLLSRALQYKSDFYVNRGVLAYILSVIGSVDTDKWKEIKTLVQGSIGGGNNFRNMAINLPNTESKVQVDKLTTNDKTEDQFAKDSEVFSTNIVSSHRVPPVLANILISGKLGAANETVQALIAFQLLVVGPIQKIVEKTLAKSLAKEGEGVSGLKAEDLRLRKITSQFNIQGLDTASRMREEAPAATNEDGTKRNVQDGLKK